MIMPIIIITIMSRQNNYGESDMAEKKKTTTMKSGGKKRGSGKRELIKPKGDARFIRRETHRRRRILDGIVRARADGCGGNATGSSMTVLIVLRLFGRGRPGASS